MYQYQQNADINKSISKLELLFWIEHGELKRFPYNGVYIQEHVFDIINK